MSETELVSIQEAAARVAVSADTVRRRLKRGELTGEREPTPQGFTWRIALPIAGHAPETPEVPAGALSTVVDSLEDAVELAQLRERVAGLECLAAELQSERDDWREHARRDSEAARELRVLLQNEQLRALPQGTTPQDAPGWAEAPGHAPQMPRDVRRRVWDWLRRK